MSRSSIPDSTRRWIISGVLLYVVVIVAVGVGLFGLLRTSEVRLEEEMGDRLQAIAISVAALIDGDLIDGWVPAREGAPVADDPGYSEMRSGLDRIFFTTEVSEINLTSLDDIIVYSTSGRPAGSENAYWKLNKDLVGQTKRGSLSVTPLYDSGFGRQKSAFAPVLGINEDVVAVVSVEAEAEFFDALTRLKQGALTTAVIVLIVLAVIGVALARLLRDIIRTRAVLAEQEKLASMGRMTAGIAHEIRNPLGIIRGAGELIAMRLGQAGLDASSADFITGEVDRLDRILTRYLAFGRGGGLNPEPLNLEALVRRTVGNMASELASTPVTVSVLGEPRDVRADDPALQQVLLNLLLNARDAALEAEDPSLELELEYGPQGVALSVRDHGAGLGGRDPERQFIPFETSKEKGSGLGLAVVRQVVEDHGGAASLGERSDGPGAVAIVTLPYTGPDQEA